MTQEEIEYWLLMLEAQLVFEEVGEYPNVYWPFGMMRQTMYIRCGEFNAMCRECLANGAAYPCGNLKPIAIYRELPDRPITLVTSSGYVKEIASASYTMEDIA
jgi:hypothetical protein